MTISFADAERLKAAGFTNWEVAKLSEARAPDGKTQPSVELGSPVWQRVLASRRDWIDDKIERGWSQEEIDNNIMNYYAKTPKRSPFDFLKAEYKQPLRKDFYDSVKQRAQRKVKASLSGYY